MLELAIIGGGPAGITAGLYACRGGLKDVVMFDMGMPGGQITQSSEIENYPGVKEVKSGLDFMQEWLPQAESFGLKFEMAGVDKITKNENGSFTITLLDGSIREAISVIIATGSVPKRGGFSGEAEFFGRGVSTCATCDGFFYKGKEVAVLGGGDTALEEAHYLAKICKKVYLIHRRDAFRAAPSTVERAKHAENIEFILNASVKNVFGDAMGVSGVELETAEGSRTLNVPGIFVFVGRTVNNGVLKQADDSYLCELIPSGEIKVDLKMRTNVSGLFAAGDVRSEAARQVVCAAADGAVAALEAMGYVDHFKADKNA